MGKPTPAPAASASPAPHAIVAHVMYIAVDVVAVLAALALIVSVAYAFVPPDAQADRRRLDRRRLEIVGAAVAAIAIVVGVARTVIVPVDSGGSFVPALDLVTLTWFGVAAIGVLLPVIPQITIGQFTVQLREAESFVNDLLTEFRNWGDTLSNYLADLSDHNEATAIDARMRQFINLRLVEAGEWLNMRDEEPRISVWLDDAGKHVLRFAYSKEIRDPSTISSVFRYDEGLMGAAFSEREIRNEIYPQEHPLFKSIAGGKRYESLLVVPIAYGDLPIGVLCIDRKTPAYFDDRQINVMKFVASLIGIAIGRSLEMQAALRGGA